PSRGGPDIQRSSRLRPASNRSTRARSWRHHRCPRLSTSPPRQSADVRSWLCAHADRPILAHTRTPPPERISRTERALPISCETGPLAGSYAAPRLRDRQSAAVARQAISTVDAKRILNGKPDTWLV